jgi:hypothetical protein
MEPEQRIIICVLYREHAEPRDIQARLSAQFGDVASSLRSVQRWCQYIQQGRELLDDEPRSGRPPVDLLDIQILSSLEKQPFYSAYSLAEILDVLEYGNFEPFTRLAWNEIVAFTSDRQSVAGATSRQRDQKYQELPPLLEKMEANKFRSILTGNEDWFMLEYQHALKWSLSREDVSERVRQQIGTKNIMPTVIWGSRRLSCCCSDDFAAQF